MSFNFKDKSFPLFGMRCSDVSAQKCVDRTQIFLHFCSNLSPCHSHARQILCEHSSNKVLFANFAASGRKSRISWLKIHKMGHKWDEFSRWKRYHIANYELSSCFHDFLDTSTCTVSKFFHSCNRTVVALTVVVISLCARIWAQARACGRVRGLRGLLW